MKYRFLHPAIITFLTALLVRILYNVFTGRGYVAQFDAHEYEQLALHIINNHCFCKGTPARPAITRAPLWPGIIALVYWLTGPTNLNARLFLSLLGSGTCVLVFYFAQDLFGRRFGLLAGIIAACYPGLFMYDGWLYSESLYTFLFLAFTYFLYRFQRKPTKRWLILSALALSLSTLTRPNGLFAIGALIAFFLIVGWKHILPWRTAIRSTLALTLLTCLIVLPWSIRNYLVSGSIVPVATGAGTILAGAYNNTVFTNPFLGSTGTWVPPDMAQPPIPETQPCCTISGEDPNQQAYVVNWILTHLHSMPRLLTLHFINIWQPIVPDGALPISQFPNRPSAKFITKLLQYESLCIFALAAFGIVTTWRRKWRELLTLYLSISLTVIMCVLLYGSVRFRSPIEPMLVILATGGLWQIVQIWQGFRCTSLETVTI